MSGHLIGQAIFKTIISTKNNEKISQRRSSNDF